MGRTAAILLLCAVAGPGLPGCGEVDADWPTLLEAQGETRPDPSIGPTLAGRGRAHVERSVAADRSDPTGPRATLDEARRIQIPPGASWRTVKAALRMSAHLRRNREHLPEHAAVLVPLPRVEGSVIVSGYPRHDVTGLALHVGGSSASPSTQITALGTEWVARRGCDAERVWKADAWSVGLYEQALEDLRALGSASEHGLHVCAADEVPASTVLGFLTAAGKAGLGAPCVEAGQRRVDGDAVSGGGSWLASHQLPNGAWHDDFSEDYCDGLLMHSARGGPSPEGVEHAGLTGLALCAFLGAGYTNRGKHPLARTVSRGLRHLKNCQRPDGVFPGVGDWSDAHAHGFAALAMVEVYGMTGSPIFKGSAQRALDALSRVWWAAGDDPLATVLTAMTLKSAQVINADCRKRGKPEPLSVDAGLVKHVRADAESFDGGKGDLRAACGLLARILLGEDARKTPDIRAGAVRLVKAIGKFAADADPAFVWVSSLVCYQVGGRDAWKPMCKALRTYVIDDQRRDGHACCRRGSWDPRAGPGLAGGRVAATALFAMCLEVYYRYDRVFGIR